MNVVRTIGFAENFPGELAVDGPTAQTREERFADLVKRQSGFLFRVAFAVVRNAHDAEDAVQESFLKLYRSGAWERMRDERAFLARTAWRIAISKRPAKPTEELDSGWPERNASSPEEAAVAADWNTMVHRLMDALPEKLRRPLALSAIEELSSREIAEIMNIEEGTVRTRILRARGILREKLAVLSGVRYGK